MLEIKTIITEATKPKEFDELVNAHLADGWELVRRDLLLKPTALYAELEREIEPEEEEEPEDDGTAEWRLSRDPAYPYKCTACGCKSHEPIKNCPNCGRVMTGGAL